MNSEGIDFSREAERNMGKTNHIVHEYFLSSFFNMQSTN